MKHFTFVAFTAVVLAARASAQTPDSLLPSVLKGMTLEQLMNIEVTSVSRRAEPLYATASAIQVITAENIRRSGASSVAEALRLAPNLQVAQVNASQWAISARGFNNVLANKLLVLIDGRTVYTPLYAGVFWDVQNLPLEQVDRIEVISGPGGTLWGANAVNGIVNIVTKDAGETQGLTLEGGGGNELQSFGHLRYGGRLSPAVSYRVFGEAVGLGSTVLANGGATAEDAWGRGQGGFRMDWRRSADDHFTLQSGFNYGRPDPDGAAAVVAMGGNAIGRWKHTISPSSDFQLQVYYDRAWRDFRNGFTEDLATYDIDGQHRWQLGRHEVIWGLGARLMEHETENLELFAFLPERRWLRLYSAFVQDEIALAADHLRLTLGSKFEHNDYTGFEVQPSGRLAWRPTERNTMWAAFSRAIRAPSRIDRDFYLFIAPSVPFIAGGDFDSETVLAYELGWRVQPRAEWSLALSTFYNEYDNLRSVEPGPPPPPNLPFTFGNGVRGYTYGAELATGYQVSDHWRLRGGYTFLKKKLSLKPGSNDGNGGTAESNDPEHQFLLQSSADLPGRFAVDAVLRYVDALPTPHVPSYIGLDLRLARQLTERLELSIVGQNLLEREHAEFVPSSPSARNIERGVYGKITWR